MQPSKWWTIHCISIRKEVDRWTCHGLLARSKKADPQFHSESYGKIAVSASPQELGRRAVGYGGR